MSDELKPSLSDLRTCIKAQHSQLKDMDGILTDVIFAAVTGEGLEELRENQYWRELAEKERWRRSGVRPTSISGPSISDDAIAHHSRPNDVVLAAAQKLADAHRAMLAVPPEEANLAVAKLIELKSEIIGLALLLPPKEGNNAE